MDLEKIKTFLENDTPLPKIIVVYGPTASGKSGMAVEIAKIVNAGGITNNGSYAEIISADSRQIYKGLDIGTGKVTRAEMGGIPHHMLDVIEPSKKYSMINFRRDVDALGIFSDANQQISKSAIIPILCGGTGLYLDAILYDMDFPENPPDWKYREELEQIRQEKGDEHLWQMLYDVDPLYANELSPANYRYIMRGLEVMRDTGRSKRESHGTRELRFSPLFLTPYTDSVENRKALYEKINLRVKNMFQYGLLDEIIYNIREYGAHCPGLETIGYAEVVDHLEGKISLEEAISLVQQHSRNYAKRQITWNKRYESQ